MPPSDRLRRTALGTALLLAACHGGGPGPESAPVVEKTEFTCELGAVPEGGAFTPFGEGATFELQLGFQGFLFVSVNAHTEEPGFDLGEAAMSVQIDGADDVNGKQPQVSFQDGVSDDILIFFSANYLSFYVGRAAQVAVRVEDATRYCLTPASGTLVDDDPCIHTGAEPICPEDSGP